MGRGNDVTVEFDAVFMAIDFMERFVRSNGGKLEHLVKTFVEARGFDVVKKVGGGWETGCYFLSHMTSLA